MKQFNKNAAVKSEAESIVKNEILPKFKILQDYIYGEYQNHLRKGLAKQLLLHIEDFARQRDISSVKADTNFDNPAMLALFEKLGYQYCGQVYFRGTPRRAYEKILSPSALSC